MIYLILLDIDMPIRYMYMYILMACVLLQAGTIAESVLGENARKYIL